jgi:hypothetical protein
MTDANRITDGSRRSLSAPPVHSGRGITTPEGVADRNRESATASRSSCVAVLVSVGALGDPRLPSATALRSDQSRNASIIELTSPVIVAFLAWPVGTGGAVGDFVDKTECKHRLLIAVAVRGFAPNQRFGFSSK